MPPDEALIWHCVAQLSDCFADLPTCISEYHCVHHTVYRHYGAHDAFCLVVELFVLRFGLVVKYDVSAEDCHSSHNSNRDIEDYKLAIGRFNLFLLFGYRRVCSS